MVRRVNRLFPDASLKHLKKIRHTDDRICQIQLGKYELIQQNIPKLQSLSIHDVKSCQIPAHPPLTRAQYHQCKQMWPTSFHEQKYITKCLEGQRFTDSELSSIRRVVDQMVISRNESGAGVTLIVENGLILAGESDDTEQHPLHHSAIRAVNSISRIRMGQSESDRGYVCTGLDAFVSGECCLMCAMALLHSRIQRIFFLTDSQPHACPPDRPFSRMKLHANEQLNHAFEVWSVEIEDGNNKSDAG
jgi:tRNA-specific adenosine deaminase 3